MANKCACPRPVGCAGFSIVELVITLAVFAIIAAIAAPSFTGLLNGNRLATASNELVTSLQFARIEAVRRNVPVVVCSSANAQAASPTCATGSWGQWIVFADRDGNDVVGAGELLRASVLGPSLVARAGAPISTATQTRFRDRVVFRPDGLAYAQSGALLDGSVNICIATTQPAQNRRDVTIAQGSRVRVDTPAADATCPAP